MTNGHNKNNDEQESENKYHEANERAMDQE